MPDATIRDVQRFGTYARWVDEEVCPDENADTAPQAIDEHTKSSLADADKSS